ncbi:TraR/DksA C4-type zinc finger protein [Alkalibacillus sp. S2W]|uniref:TraR/DksA C4-type zinc finger protein n=1 Tax=Alkalibacillus sp. S2W TaxID=3386553 RepID=UPI00398C9C07
MYNPMWDELRVQLMEEKNRLEQRVKEAEDLPALIDESVGELNSLDDQHPGDSGTELYERQKDLTMFRHAKEQLEEIDHALNKMDDGTYGICEKTGKPIPLERLQAMPTARYTIKHSHDEL